MVKIHYSTDLKQNTAGKFNGVEYFSKDKLLQTIQKKVLELVNFAS